MFTKISLHCSRVVLPLSLQEVSDLIGPIARDQDKRYATGSLRTKMRSVWVLVVAFCCVYLCQGYEIG